MIRGRRRQGVGWTLFGTGGLGMVMFLSLLVARITGVTALHGISDGGLLAQAAFMAALWYVSGAAGLTGMWLLGVKEGSL